MERGTLFVELLKVTIFLSRQIREVSLISLWLSLEDLSINLCFIKRTETGINQQVQNIGVKTFVHGCN